MEKKEISNREKTITALLRVDEACSMLNMTRVQHYQNLNDIQLVKSELERLYKLEEEHLESKKVDKEKY